MAIKHLKAGEHTCFGHISAEGPLEEGPEFIERDSLMVYTGVHESMDGEVEVTEPMLDLLVENHNARMAKFMKGGAIPLKACPPLQLDHSTSAAVTIGRVVGLLRKGQFMDEETGTDRIGVFGPVRVMGSENVAKVKDGRWIHQSVGVDFDNGKLNELSVVPFPAALSASFLSAKRARLAATQTPPAKAEGAKMTFMERVKSMFKFSKDEDAKAREEKMRSYLAGNGMTDDDAVKHLAEMDDESMKKFSDEMDEHDKKMSAEQAEKDKLTPDAAGGSAEMAAVPPAGKDLDTQEKNEKEHKDEVKSLSAPAPSGVQFSAEEKTKFIQMAAGFKATSKAVQMAAKQSRLSARLSGLRASAKITPAEVKKIDLVKLSAENDATIEAVFKSYEGREPVILAGVIGTSKAQTVGELTAQINIKRIEDQARKNMTFTAGAIKSTKAAAEPKMKKLSTAGLMNDDETSENGLVNENQKQSKMEGEDGKPGKDSEDLGSDGEGGEDGDGKLPKEGVQYDLAYAEICRLIDSGSLDDAKAQIAGLMTKMKGGCKEESATLETAQSDTKMSALAESVKTLHNQFEALVSMVGPKLGVESSEIDKGV